MINSIPFSLFSISLSPMHNHIMDQKHIKFLYSPNLFYDYYVYESYLFEVIKNEEIVRFHV